MASARVQSLHTQNHGELAKLWTCKGDANGDHEGHGAANLTRSLRTWDLLVRAWDWSIDILTNLFGSVWWTCWNGTSVTSITSHIMWSLRKWGNWSWFHGWYQCFLDHWGSGEQGGAYSNLQLHIAGWSANSIKRPLRHCEYAIAQRSAVWGELCWKKYTQKL